MPGETREELLLSTVGQYGGLSENGPHRLMLERVVPSEWKCLGRFRRSCLVAGGVSLKSRL